MSSRRELRFGRHESVSVVTHRPGRKIDPLDSVVPMLVWNSRFDSAIPRFESWCPSQPVRGPFWTHRLRFIPGTWVTLWRCPVIAIREAARPLRRYVGARVADGPSAAGVYRVEMPENQQVAALALLRADPAVVFAEPLPALGARPQ